MTVQNFDFQKGEVLLVDKPLNWTSFDVVNKLRWRLKKKYGIKKFKVGHAGTLDPLATGLLVLCSGKKTKTIPEIVTTDKTYTGTMLLGKTTPSFDLETEYDAEYPTEHIDKEMLELVTQSFHGEQMQTPPIFSAKKIDGKRAYESARKGKHIEMKENKIFIHSFKIDASNFPEIDFEVSCSKGTYIRSIANDFGEKCNSGGTLIKLRRTSVGNFDINQAKSVEEWIKIIDSIEV